MIDHWTYPLKIGETLSSNEWIEFHIHRFLTSRFKALCLSGGAEGKAIGFTAVILWAECYRQDPAGTLPNDDLELAHLAGFGVDLDGWRKVRDRVLHGWQPTHCEDATEGVNRLGHPLIAEIAARSYHRKAGKAAGREAAQSAMVKTRIRKQLIKIGLKRIAGVPDVVSELARWLETAGLWITEDNVRKAAEVVAGVTSLRVVNGGKDDE
jgi:hypothetical protein